MWGGVAARDGREGGTTVVTSRLLHLNIKTFKTRKILLLGVKPFSCKSLGNLNLLRFGFDCRHTFVQH